MSDPLSEEQLADLREVNKFEAVAHPGGTSWVIVQLLDRRAALLAECERLRGENKRLGRTVVSQGNAVVFKSEQASALGNELSVAKEQRDDALAVCERLKSELVEALTRAERAEAAVDDLWSCMDKPGIDHVQPETRKLASDLHTALYHATDFEHRARALVESQENQPQ